MIKIAVVDDKLVNRKTLQMNLSNEKNIQLVFEAVNGEDFLRKMDECSKDDLPQLVLMDIDMPVMNGIDSIAIGAIKYPDVKFLVLTVFDDDEKLFEAIQAGACGYLLKEDDATEIAQAIENAVNKNDVPMSPSIARRTLQWMKAAKTSPAFGVHKKIENDLLSERETEILLHMVNGLDYKKIADKLFISPLTVRTHISKIYDKLHVNSKAQAIQLAHKYNWV